MSGLKLAFARTNSTASLGQSEPVDSGEKPSAKAFLMNTARRSLEEALDSCLPNQSGDRHCPFITNDLARITTRGVPASEAVPTTRKPARRKDDLTRAKRRNPKPKRKRRRRRRKAGCFLCVPVYFLGLWTKNLIWYEGSSSSSEQQSESPSLSMASSEACFAESQSLFGLRVRDLARPSGATTLDHLGARQLAYVIAGSVPMIPAADIYDCGGEMAP